MNARYVATPLRTAVFVMLVGMLTVWPGIVHAYVTIEIFVAWDQAAFEHLANSESGGLIRVDGDYQFTLPGVCGMEFHNVEAWHWSDAGGVMADLPSNGAALPGNSTLSYTGPYSGCDNNILMFTTPATPSGEFPEGAQRLVVQVGDVSDIYYLNESYNAIPEPEWPEDHEWESVCEMFPEVCERDMTVCLQLFDQENCESDAPAASLGFAAGSARRLDAHMTVAQAAAAKKLPEAAVVDRALTAAQIEAIRVGQYLQRLNAVPGNASTTHRDLAAMAVQACAGAIAKARMPGTSSKSVHLMRAGRQCRNARSLIDSLGWREHAGQQEKLLWRSGRTQ
jgi:hypothetical protein